MTFSKLAHFFRIMVIALLSLSLIYLPPLQVYAQQNKGREKREPKPPRTDAPTIKEDLTPALSTKTTPTETLTSLPGKPGLPSVMEQPSLPNLDDTKKLKEDKLPKTFTATPSSQCGFRDENCKRDKGEKPNKISQVTNRLDQMIAGTQFSPDTGWENRPWLPVVSSAATPMLMQTPPQNSGDLWNARLDPHNRVGSSGEDLFSGNYNWSMPLISLPGRSGLDLGLSLSYNSLVWQKSGNTIFYDTDYGFPSPGFRLGFPVLEGPTTNAVTGKLSYLLILPSGQRVELRQQGTSNYYESADSSYFQLETNYGAQTLTLRTSNGTQLRYQPQSGVYRCNQIKDANGNFLTVSYTSFGKINSVTDTLGRVLNFAYDGYYHLTDITQTWAGQSHLWAHFDYANITINTNFAGGIYYVNGPANNTQIAVLSRIVTNDGARYVFVYNNYGQATHFWRYGQEDNQRACVGYLMDLPASGLADCPRPYLRGEWAVEWFGGWAESYFSFDPSGAVGIMTATNGTIYKEFFATSGWQKGLPTQTETWANNIKRKWTTTTWTQDNTGVAYFMNPRPTETNIYDEANNRRRMTTGYRTITLPSGGSFSASNKTTEYNADATTAYRSTYTDYEEGTNYLSRQLLGLPKLSRLYDGDQGAVPPTNIAPASKVEFFYDEAGEYLQALATAATQHDAAFGDSYRGNGTRVRRYDVSNTNYVENKSAYNTAGSVIFTRDPLNNQTNISYNDSFSDDVNRNTFAYPTTVTDPGGNSSSLKYNFDFSAIMRTQDPKGLAFTKEYDWAGRLTRQTNLTNQAYTRYYYAPSHYYVQSWSTVNDLTAANEFYSITLFDGANRVRATVGDHPGSIGGQRSVYYVYDNMGRLSMQSNPTEINGSWTPVGDDQTYVWKPIAYDWNSRPTVRTNTDGTQQTLEYSSCGCAGSTEVTVKDEGQMVNGILKRRKEKTTQDVFGRTFKEQAFEWDTTTVNSTTISSFNIRDQATNIKQYEGTNGTFQEILMTYDGYGRLQTSKYPIESYASSYTYDNADRPLTVTDARGASTTYAYNTRGLKTSIVYGVPSGVAATPSVAFAYDAVGNRTLMADGQGQTNYSYDTLSRLTSESRTFNGVTGAWQLNYGYNLAGQLTSLVDVRNNQTVNYGYHKNGALSSITTPGFGGITQYATGMQYRTSGAIKSASYGDGYNLSTNYDIRQQLNEYKLATSGGSVAAWSQAQFHQNSTVKFSQNQLDEKFDRAFSYDHQGRISEAYSGIEARNFNNQVSNPATLAVPYRQNHTYNVWGQTTVRSGKYWSTDDSFTDTFTNGRRTGTQYDAAGNITSDSVASTYDAAGRNNSIAGGVNYSVTTNSFDGDGAPVKREYLYRNTYPTTYYLRSSVLGGKTIAEIEDYHNGQPIENSVTGSVYAGAEKIASQYISHYNGTRYEYAQFTHNDLLTGTKVISFGYGAAGPIAEFDPGGVNPGFSDPANIPPSYIEPDIPSFFYIGSSYPQYKCQIDGSPAICHDVERLLRLNLAAVVPGDTLIPVIYQGKQTFARYQATGDGYQGYVPVTARYTGDGFFAPINFSEPTLKRPGDPTDTNFHTLNGSTGETLLGRQVEFWAGIRNPNEEFIKNKAKSYKALPEFLTCLGFSDLSLTDIKPVANGEFAGWEQAKALFGVANKRVANEQKGNLGNGQVIVCHSKGCANLAKALEYAKSEGFNVDLGGIVAVAPDTGLGGLQTLRDAVVPLGGFFNIVKSDGDGALLTSTAPAPNNVIQGNINNDGKGNPGRL